jgi:hypothetical protein
MRRTVSLCSAPVNLHRRVIDSHAISLSLNGVFRPNRLEDAQRRTAGKDRLPAFRSADLLFAPKNPILLCNVLNSRSRSKWTIGDFSFSREIKYN